MNVRLYNALVDAYNFLLLDEKNCKKIKSYEGDLRAYKYELDVHTPSFEEDPISWGIAIFLLWVVFPIGLFYIFSNKIKNKIKRKKYERKKQQTLNSLEEIKYRENKLKKIRETEILLEQVKKVREEYYYNNYQKYLSFLPEHLRHIKDIDILMHYVKSGQANTLEKAQEYYAIDLRELDEMRERNEERQERERHYRETQDALSAIVQNQEKINHELETANKYRNGTYRW